MAQAPQDPAPYLTEQHAARAAIERYAAALREVEAARTAIPPAVRAYYLKAAEHLTATRMAAEIGYGDSSFRAQVADLAAQRRERERARRLAARTDT